MRFPGGAALRKVFFPYASASIFRENETKMTENETTREKNASELSVSQHGMDVFTAIRRLSKCPNNYGDDTYSLTQFQICEPDNGTQVEVSDASLAAKMNRSPRVRKALQEVLEARAQTQASKSSKRRKGKQYN